LDNRAQVRIDARVQSLAGHPIFAAIYDRLLASPDPHMASRLRRHLAAEPPEPAEVSVVDAPAEELPFEDDSFDTVVTTLVLCSVEDPVRAVAEA
jgi:hypothetical protein